MQWERGTLTPEFFSKGGAAAMVDDRPIQHIAEAHNMTVEEAEALVAERVESVRVYVSYSGYTVFISDTIPFVSGWPEMVHLSIKNRERSALLDWRDLQEIKNDLVGEENEAVQLFPAESRLVDEANQFHLWCLKDPEERFPFGYTQRLVLGRKTAEKCGAEQRPLKTRKKNRKPSK